MFLERPTCEKENCDKPALTLFSGVMLCGDCFAEYLQRQEKLKRRLILEE